MRIACLQFAPQEGDIHESIRRADAALSSIYPQDLDLLVLPELAFTGCEDESIQEAVCDSSEHTFRWAQRTALNYHCVVAVGYPEKLKKLYNSALTVDSGGVIVTNYKKSFLNEFDERWASEGPHGFGTHEIPQIGRVVIGIGMDLNPYKFEAPWTEYEFAHYILSAQVNLAIILMAWPCQDQSVLGESPCNPDVGVLSYWVTRLEPLRQAKNEEEIILIIANCCGVKDEATYAGTSCVLGIKQGEVYVYNVLGRGETNVLMVDTNQEPRFKMVSNLSASASTYIVQAAIPRRCPGGVLSSWSDSSRSSTRSSIASLVLEHHSEALSFNAPVAANQFELLRQHLPPRPRSAGW